MKQVAETLKTSRIMRGEENDKAEAGLGSEMDRTRKRNSECGVEDEETTARAEAELHGGSRDRRCGSKVIIHEGKNRL